MNSNLIVIWSFQQQSTYLKIVIQSFLKPFYKSSLILIGIFVSLIGAGFAAFIQQGNLRDEMIGNMFESLEGYNQDDMVRKFWDKVQVIHQCCGVTDYKEYK